MFDGKEFWHVLAQVSPFAPTLYCAYLLPVGTYHLQPYVEDMIEFRCYDGSIRFDGVCGRQCPGGRLSTLGSTFWTAFAHILEFYHCEG